MTKSISAGADTPSTATVNVVKMIDDIATPFSQKEQGHNGLRFASIQHPINLTAPLNSVSRLLHITVADSSTCVVTLPPSPRGSIRSRSRQAALRHLDGAEAGRHSRMARSNPSEQRPEIHAAR